MTRGFASTSRIIGLGTGGLLAAGLLTASPGALAAPAVLAGAAGPTAAARAHVASWHTVFSQPDGATPSNAVETVVATGKTSGWAFLASGAAYRRTGGSRWQPAALPQRGGSVNVAAAASPGDVWAAYRDASGTYLDHWNGRRWTTAKSFPGRLTALSVLGPRDVWAFGGLGRPDGRQPAGVFHFDGRRWTEVSSTLQGGSALSDRNVWAYRGTTIAHYDGRQWTDTDVAALFPAATAGQTTRPALTGIIAAGPHDVDATGAGPAGPHGATAVILHGNGRSWERAASGSSASPDGQELTADGRGGLWLPATNAAGIPLLLRYSGGQVTVVTLPSPTGWPPASYSVSRIPGTGEVLSGGAVDNPGDPAVNRSVVFQYS
jgi:hypothetical protein